jgi:predicted CXXCH cytochrome family protein
MKKEMLVRGTRFLLFYLLVGLSNLALGDAAWAAGPSLKVISPPNGVWVTEEKLFLAGVASEVGATVKISGVDVADRGQVAINEGGVFGAAITLSKGQNTIKLTAGNSTAEIQVFYTADPKKIPPAKDFKRFYVHHNPAELNCQECHRLRKGVFDFKRIIPARANCTVNCHQDKGKAKHVHGPVGSGVCISCHSPHGSTRPAFMERSGAELCTVCHQAKREDFEQKYIHSPMEDGCVECHDPHESNMRYQLRAEGNSSSALCYTCHEEEIFKRKTQHSPVAEGDCIACHRPHSSPNPKLLIASPDGGALCFVCHEDRKEEFTMQYLHAPAADNCAECHDPHSSNASYMLKEEGGKLCAMCHREYSPEIYEAIDTATVKHPPVDKGACVDCHRPHSSNYAQLLKNSMEKLCFSCHDELGEYVAASSNRHGPVQTGDCTACHNVHGSKFTKLLARYYPLNFYISYAPEYYDLCFGCHNKEIAKNRTTENLTNFRDGNYNLHYFHVNNEKGRTCTACHDPHASNQPKHIRYEVPFGDWWSYPINITKTETGATCVVGCHAPKGYDRKNRRSK